MDAPTKPAAYDAAEMHGMKQNSKTEVVIIWANPGGGAETIPMHEPVAFTPTDKMVHEGNGYKAEAPAAEPHAAAATHHVTVGGPAGLIFTPDNVKANVGDMVIFDFLAKNHTATQSTFDNPCDPLEGGMNTGFQPNPDNGVSPPPQVAMQVMVDTPLWFYCAQGNHCGKGMTFSINPTAEKTQAMFQSMAIQQRGNGDGSAITGGGEAPPPEGAEPPPPEGAQPPPPEGAQPPPEGAPEAPSPPVESAPEAPSLPAEGEGSIPIEDVQPPAESESPAEVDPPSEGEQPSGDGENPTEGEQPSESPAEGDATPEEPPSSTGDIVPGTGSVLPDGSCACAVVVGAGAFPAVGTQGKGAFGGMPGSIPVDAVGSI